MARISDNPKISLFGPSWVAVFDCFAVHHTMNIAFAYEFIVPILSYDIRNPPSKKNTNTITDFRDSWAYTQIGFRGMGLQLGVVTERLGVVRTRGAARQGHRKVKRGHQWRSAKAKQGHQ